MIDSPSFAAAALLLLLPAAAFFLIINILFPNLVHPERLVALLLQSLLRDCTDS